MKTIIISGGSSGIGLACAQKFLEHDYFVCNFDLLNNECLQNNARYAWFEVDVRKKEQIIQAISKVVISHTKIDSLIVSAGKHLSATIENTSDESIGIKHSFENGRIIIDFGDRYDFQDFIKQSLEGTKPFIMLSPGSKLNAEYKRAYKGE